MKKFEIFFALVMCMVTAGFAQQDDPKDEYSADGPWISKLDIETRLAFNYEHIDKHTYNDGTGFRGEYVNLVLEGKIYRTLNYAWRQRLNLNTDQSFWDATDYLELRYSPIRQVTISAGKQVVAIGGYEYDRSPIDLYYCSDFWQYIACYQLGVSATYQFSSKDKVLFQFCNSPFRKIAVEGAKKNLGNNSYGLSLMWYGDHSFYHSIFSANAFQLTNGRWIGYLALGNRFDLCRHCHLDVDYTNRASSSAGFFKDFTVAGEISGQPHWTTNLFAKYTYDQNHGNTDDLYVLSGTQMHGVSTGVEVTPLRKYPNLLKIYFAAGYTWGDAMNPKEGLCNKDLNLTCGFKADINLLHGIKNLVQSVHKRKTQEI